MQHVLIVIRTSEVGLLSNMKMLVIRAKREFLLTSKYSQAENIRNIVEIWFADSFS
jgi:nitrate reductase NapAB chaperone NapD